MIMNKGILYGLSSYLMWGVFPVYFKLLYDVPPLQILGHRVAWSLVLLALVISLRREWPQMRQALRSRRTLTIYTLAALLLSANWLIYIWAVQQGHIVETSLGYFTNPLMSVLLGVIFLRERLRPVQWLPVGLAAFGVIYLTIQFGSLPWIALALAFTFGMYGFVKKLAPLNSLHSLTLETGLLFVPAVVFLGFVQTTGEGAFAQDGWSITLLLAAAGVITAVPLLLFGAAARLVPLSTMGILQYVAPTCQFLIGVFLYREGFDLHRLIGFLFIWAALLIFTAESLWTQRRQLALAAAEARTGSGVR
jgi:chloramphenicol-sensitive protein RarD